MSLATAIRRWTSGTHTDSTAHVDARRSRDSRRRFLLEPWSGHRPKRIVIADSSPILGSGVAGMLVAHGGFDAHAVQDLTELERAVAANRLDAGLIDLDLLPRGGIDAIARLSGFSRVPLFVWGRAPTDKEKAAARLAGASGFVRKDVPFAVLAATLHELTGGRSRSPGLATAGSDGGIG